MTPRISQVRQDDTHRLIPVKFGDRSVLDRLAENQRQLEDLFELEGATNNRLLGEANLLPGINVYELLFGVSYAHIVNAAFTHAQPAGSRFNGPERGAWYSGWERETSIAEVTFHKMEELREIRWRKPETFTFDDYLADFRSEFHDLRRDKRFADCLSPDSYLRSQQVAKELLSEGSAGIVYPSVRRHGGTCIVCFRPALVTNVRQGMSETITVELSES